MKINDILEARQNTYEVYHNTYSSAMSTARDYAEQNGYEISEDDWHSEVTFGQGRPKNGNSTRHNFPLEQNGQPSKPKRFLAVQVADLDNDRYELNMYIS